MMLAALKFMSFAFVEVEEIGFALGIYDHVAGNLIYGHCVKIIGWGEERIAGATRKYWTIANSWGLDWGQNGK